MKRQLPSTSQVEEPQRNVRSCVFRDRFAQSTAPHLRLFNQRVTQTTDERAVSLGEPRGFLPQVQSMAPHLHVPHQSPTPAPGGSISCFSDAPHSLQPLAQSTAPHIGAHHRSLAPSLDEMSVSVSSAIPAVLSNPLVRFMDPHLMSHTSASVERSVSLIFEAPTGSQPLVRSTAPHLSGRLQSRTLASDESSTSMSSEAPPAGSHTLAQLTVPHLSQQHQNHMSALGDRSATLFSTTPAGYQPFAQSTAQHLGAHNQNCTSAPHQNCHPVLRCIAPHLRVHFGSHASASCERIGSVSSMDTTRALAQSRVETEPMGELIQSAQARQVQIARQISSLQAPLPPAPLSVRSRRNPVIVGGSWQDDRPDSSVPRLRQNLVGPSSNYVRNQNPRIMPADRHSGMRMDIDNMSYEELLALGERIGKVNTGLKTSELFKYVKKVIFCGEQDEAEQCVICLMQYGDGDVMGKLQCSHDYHYTCLVKWIKEKAVCPICRCTPTRF